VSNPFFRPGDNASQISPPAHDKPDNPLCLTQLVGRTEASEQPPSGSPKPPDIRDYPLVREFRTKLEGLYQLSGANLDEALKAYHAGLPPGYMKAVEKERREYEAAKAFYDKRMIDLGLNQTIDRSPQVGRPIFMQEPKPGAILVENARAEDQIRIHNEVVLESQAMRLRGLMGPNFEEEARKYGGRLQAWERTITPTQ
jgi:hypothetical protein